MMLLGVSIPSDASYKSYRRVMCLDMCLSAETWQAAAGSHVFFVLDASILFSVRFLSVGSNGTKCAMIPPARNKNILVYFLQAHVFVFFVRFVMFLRRDPTLFFFSLKKYQYLFLFGRLLVYIF